MPGQRQTGQLVDNIFSSNVHKVATHENLYYYSTTTLCQGPGTLEGSLANKKDEVT